MTCFIFNVSYLYISMSLFDIYIYIYISDVYAVWVVSCPVRKYFSVFQKMFFIFLQLRHIYLRMLSD